MSVRIQFDKPASWHYTNLDFVTGKVILVLQTEATISAVNVKLEGESRSRLAGPKPSYNERSDKKRTELEVHKLLYRVETVFPTLEIQQQSTSNSSYTLSAGQYEYQFRFKFPFNNSCLSNSNILRDLKVGGVRVEITQATSQHVKKALPPTLSGFPGEADIKYYVKATVVRPKFYQENLRFQADIKFLPIEPPRPLDRHEETFARRKQQFARSVAQPQKKGLFRKSSVVLDSSKSGDPPTFQVDARLPNPAIITCNEPLPLRILVQKLTESSETVYLGTLQIELIGCTHVRAHDLTRSESSSWVLTSQSNMNMPLGSGDDPAFKEWKVPSRLWENISLPNTVAPSFDTCNISRTYELEVRVGLAHGGPGAVKPELIVLPLRLPVKVYSGIAPPPALLKAMSLSHSPEHLHLSTPVDNPEMQNHFYPQTPVTPTYNQMPQQQGTFVGDPAVPFPEDDAPPSYEDAMAEDLGPIDGPRRDYSTPVSPPRQDTAFGSESKGGGIFRQPSERLFPQNDIQARLRTSFSGRFSDSTTRSSPSTPIIEYPAQDSGNDQADGIAYEGTGKAPQRSKSNEAP